MFFIVAINWIVLALRDFQRFTILCALCIRHIKCETGAGTSYCAFSLYCETCVFCTILCTLYIFRYSVYLVYFQLLYVSCVFCIAVCPARPSINEGMGECIRGHRQVLTCTLDLVGPVDQDRIFLVPTLLWSHILNFHFLATNIGHVDHLELLLICNCFVDICI